MGEIIYGDIKQYIDELAQSLGVAAEYVYELLVKQQVISGIVWTSVSVIMIALSLSVILFLITALRKAEWESVKGVGFFSDSIKEPTNGYAKIIAIGDGALVLVVSILATFFLIVSIIAVLENGMQIFNPEYYAIREIMDVFKGGGN